MILKLKVLNSRIQKLESLTNELLIEVESSYRQKLEALKTKKITINQKIKKIQTPGEST